MAHLRVSAKPRHFSNTNYKQNYTRTICSWTSFSLSFLQTVKRKSLKDYIILNMRNHRIWQIEVKCSARYNPPIKGSLTTDKNNRKTPNEKLWLFFRLAELNNATWIKHFEHVTALLACLPKGKFVGFFREEKSHADVFVKKHAIQINNLFQGNKHCDSFMLSNFIFFNHARIMVSTYDP